MGSGMGPACMVPAEHTHRANRAPRLSQLLAQREQAVLLVKVL